MTDEKMKSYGRALRIRRRIFLWISAAGLLGLAASVILLPSGGLPPVARSLYRGGSFGILIAGLANLLYTCWLLGHPARWKATWIRETDERTGALRREAGQMAGTALLFLLVVTGFVLAAADWRLGILLECLAICYFLFYLAALWRLSKKV